MSSLIKYDFIHKIKLSLFNVFKKKNRINIGYPIQHIVWISGISE